MGLVVSLHHQDTGSIPGLVQWVKGSGVAVLLGFDPWPGSPYALGWPKQTNKNPNQSTKQKKPNGLKPQRPNSKLILDLSSIGQYS